MNFTHRKQGIHHSPSNLSILELLHSLVELGQSHDCRLETQLASAGKVEGLVHIGKTAHQGTLDGLVAEGQRAGVNVDVELAGGRQTDAAPCRSISFKMKNLGMGSLTYHMTMPPPRAPKYCGAIGYACTARRPVSYAVITRRGMIALG
jgi:hypothetical protein